jgi:hypothetical protein
MWPSQRKQAREAERLVEENHAKIERARKEHAKIDADFKAKWEAKAAADEKKLKEAQQRMGNPSPSDVLMMIAKHEGNADDQKALRTILSHLEERKVLIDIFVEVIIPMQKEIGKLKEALLKSE